jgi:hypothetical protein
MKCFECDSKCLTKYIFGEKDKNGFESVVAVRKDCINCEWTSHPTIGFVIELLFMMQDSKSVQPVCAWNQRILSNGNKSGTCSPIIRYIKRSRREILTSIRVLHPLAPHKSLKSKQSGFKTPYSLL